MAAPLTRRRLLGVGGSLAVAALAGGCSGAGAGAGGIGRARSARPGCVPRTALESRRTLAGLPLVYEVDGRRAAFRFEGAFSARLGSWAERLVDVLPSPPTALSSYGSWTDGGSACDSWHDAGRAFDLARVQLSDGSSVSCRYDQWRSLDGAELEEARRRYWALAAGLHQRFADVLTYLYNEQHANHIHLDNGRSGNENPAFNPRSRVQVQAVQALCRYLWGLPVEITGRWDAATRTAAGRVLDQLNLADRLEGTDSWSAFLQASAALGRE